MTGSSLAPIIIPIAGTISLAVWLIMVLSADGRPHKTADGPEHTGDSPSPATLDDRHQSSTGQVVPAAPAGTGSCPNTSTRALPGAGALPSGRPRGGWHLQAITFTRAAVVPGRRFGSARPGRNHAPSCVQAQCAK
jgi:hypothetical protein